MNRTYFLKKHILLLLAGFIGEVVLMGIINSIAAFGGHIQTQRAYELFSVYNDYGEAVESLWSTAVDYFVRDTKENQKIVLQKADYLEELSSEMKDLADKIGSYGYQSDSLQLAADVFAFQDSCDLSREFTRQARSYVNGGSKTAVQDIRHMAKLTLLQYGMLQQHVENIVNDSMLFNKRIWRFQLLAIFVILTAMVFYSLYTLYHLSNQVLQPIVLLTRLIQRFHGKEDEKEENLSVFSSGYEELRILYDAYSEMTDTIQQQIVELEDKVRISEELRRKETALSSAELSLMQSLLTPHFLYNCLSTISALATIEQAKRTYQGSVLIANFLRESLNNVGQYITIWEEVNYTEHYIEIQKMRFADTILFTISCDPDCARVQVPAILLQPLIENAITHGVKSMSGGAEITATVVLANDGVELCVSDNGAGISEETIKELKEVLAEDYTPGKGGVGLRSVAYRLRSIYGQRARVELESKSGCTRVRLLIPFIEKK